MLITYNGLCELVEQGCLLGVDPSRINAASIDITLGDVIFFEVPIGKSIDLSKKQSPEMRSISIGADPYYLEPGEFVLGQSREVFSLPDDVACEFKLKSSAARSGLQHALAGWVDPGFTDSVLTLELTNQLRHQSLMIRAGMPIGQLVFFRGDPVPVERSYRTIGQYNGDRSAQPSKGIR